MDTPETTPETAAAEGALTLNQAWQFSQDKKILVEITRFLHGQGWTPATSSNFSVRLPHADGFAISVSGVDKGSLTSDDFILVNPEGSPFLESESRKPSAETLLHALVYKLNPEMKTVLHMHSVNSTVVSKLFESQGSIILRDFEILKGFDGIRSHQVQVFVPVFPNSQDMVTLASDLEKYYQQNPLGYGFLLAGHGLYTWGASPEEAKRHAEVFEFLFECILELRRHGHPDYS